MEAMQSMRRADVRAHLMCALLLSLSAGCGALPDATSDGDVGSRTTRVDAGNVRPQGLPPPPCLVCPRTLASGPTPTGLAVTNSGVFWTGGGSFNNAWTFGIFSVPLSGGSTSLFYDSPTFGVPPNSIVAAGGAFYWQQPGGSNPGTWSISQSGGTATQLGTIWGLTAAQVQAVAATATTEMLGRIPIHFTTVVTGDPDNSHLWKFASSTLLPTWTTTMVLDGSEIDTTSPQGGLYYPDSVTLDGSNVYFVAARYGGNGRNAVYQMSLGGDTPLYLGLANFGSPIAVYGSTVYYARDNAIEGVPVGGGIETTLVTDIGWPTTFAVDASTSTLYWTCTTCGTVSKQSFTGTTRTTIASREVAPKFIAVDSAYAYWGATNSVRSHAK